MDHTSNRSFGQFYQINIYYLSGIKGHSAGCDWKVAKELHKKCTYICLQFLSMDAEQYELHAQALRHIISGSLSARSFVNSTCQTASC